MDEKFARWIQDVQESITDVSKVNPEKYIVEVIGDGNLNDVHRVIDKDDDTRSIIIKRAPPYIKCLGPMYPLSVARSKIEYEALCWFDRIAPGSVPRPYVNQDKFHSFLMEDLQGYGVMKKGLVRGHLDVEAGLKVVRYITRIHEQTTEGKLGKEEFDRLKRTFVNREMVSLTRDYVFTFPFQRDHPTNRCSPEVANYLSLVDDDEKLLQNASDLRSIFLEKKDCLLHGDLHTASIMTRGSEAKMIDLEFACVGMVGPMGFDIGVLLANYLFSYHAHRIRPNVYEVDAKFYERSHRTISASISDYFGDAESRLTSDELTSLARDVLGFTGCELIRRIVGAAHVEDLEGNPDAEVQCLKLGVNLVLAHKDIKSASVSGLMAVLGLG